MDKRNVNDIIAKIPNYFTYIGILIALLSLIALVFAVNILFY